MSRPVRLLPISCLILTSVIIGSTATAGTPSGTTAPDINGNRIAAGTDAPGALRGGPTMLSGWPQSMGTTAPFAPVGVVLADLDGDGEDEVVAGSTDNLLRVWQIDGTLRAGWPVNVGGQIQSKVAVGDLDGDGDLEIVVNAKSGMLHIFHDDGTAMTGWPQTSGLTFGFLSPTLYDLDDDDQPEVLVGSGQNVMAWHADGTMVTGFPAAVGATITATLAVGDVIGDASPEIFATSSQRLTGLAADGSILSGWPQIHGLSTSYAAPSIGDIDDDGVREVFCVGYQFGVSTSLFGFKPDGSTVPGFPISYPSNQTYSCPVLGDLDDDGDLEIFSAGKQATTSNFYAWDHTGTILPGWPTTVGATMEGSALLLDFDDDADIEAVIGDNFSPGSMYGYNVDGSSVPEFPFGTPGGMGPNSPVVSDVDGDGLLNMAMTGTNGQVALWAFDRAYDPTTIEWGASFHDIWNTNQYGFVVPTGPIVAVGDVASASSLRIEAARPNPFRSATRVAFELDEDAVVRAGVFDIAGRQVRSLGTAARATGRHELSWDGRTDAGQLVPGGVYWMRIAMNGTHVSEALLRVE